MEPNANMQIHSRTILFFGSVAEQLRQVLIRSQNEEKQAGRSGRGAISDARRADFQRVLDDNLLNLLALVNAPGETNDRVERQLDEKTHTFAEENNLFSIPP